MVDDYVVEQIRFEVTAFRAALEEAGAELAPLAPGLDESQLAQIEERVGLVFPAELRALYSITNGGKVALGDGIYRAEYIPDALSMHRQNFWEIAPHFESGYTPLGEPPASDVVPFQHSDIESLWIATPGPDEGRLFAFMGRPESLPAWRPIAGSLTGFMRASTEVVRAGLVIVGSPRGRFGTFRYEHDSDEDRKLKALLQGNGVDPDIFV